MDRLTMWILEGTCYNPGHDWKDGYKRGEKVLAYSRTLPPPYAPDQHPRVGNTISAITPEHFHLKRVGLLKFLRLIPTIIRDAREQRKWPRQRTITMKTDAIDALITLIEKDVGLRPGGTCQDEPDGEAVGSTAEGPMEMTFGHVRRARKELNDLHQ